MKINVNDIEKITAALAEANGRASSHVAEWADIDRVARQADAWLDERKVPKSARTGVVAHWSSAGPGKAYARKAFHVLGNTCTLRRGAHAWYMVEVIRTKIWPTTPERLKLYLPAATADAVRRFAFDGAVETPDA